MEPNSREFYKQCSFQKYCNAVLHNEACDAHRELRTHKAKEVTFSDMTLDEARQLHTFDEYFKRETAETVFEKAGKKITPKLLLEAIRTLPEEKRKAILLYYFEGMSDIKALSIMERSITMSEKRRDNKNRILRTGESQRKDGRYAYKYIDTFGKPQFVYSWKLVPTDKTPAGKRDDIALREKEKEIQKDLDDGIDHIGKKMTVCQLYAKQIRHRANVRHGTKQGRKQLMRILQEDKLGACRIENVKLSDAKEWALRMKEKGYGFKTINNHKRSLKAAFYTAIQDDCIRKNPFDFQLNTVLEDDTEPKEPLSPTQEAAFLSFVQHDKVYQKYYDEIIILLGTGLRISELCGLTEADIDLDKQLINVDHQLLKIADVGYYVETPKTKSGNRVIPMSEKVLEAFQRVLNKRKYAQPVILEGYTKFLFLNRNGLPKVAVNYESMFRGLVRKYTKTQKVALPKVMTPHTLRHTFCTTLANAGMNPKALQYIMGHSNINMTLNYYAHTTSETSITEMKRLIA